MLTMATALGSCNQNVFEKLDTFKFYQTGIWGTIFNWNKLKRHILSVEKLSNCLGCQGSLFRVFHPMRIGLHQMEENGRASPLISNPPPQGNNYQIYRSFRRVPHNLKRYFLQDKMSSNHSKVLKFGFVWPV